MKLSELKIFEAEQAPAGSIELKDVIEFFPGGYAKAVQKLWGKDRLVYNGMQFFKDGSLGEAYDKALETVEAVVKNSTFTVPVHLRLDGNLDFDEFEYDAHVDEAQEVYLGYSAEHDQLYIGADVWLSEDDFNEEWDKKFKANMGVEFDSDIEEHSALFDEAWKGYHAMRGYGILFELSKNLNRAEPVIESQGGFYQGVRKDPRFKSFNLVDIRLD